MSTDMQQRPWYTRLFRKVIPTASDAAAHKGAKQIKKSRAEGDLEVARLMIRNAKQYVGTAGETARATAFVLLHLDQDDAEANRRWKVFVEYALAVNKKAYLSDAVAEQNRLSAELIRQFSAAAQTGQAADAAPTDAAQS